MTSVRRSARRASRREFGFEPKDHLTLAGPDGLGLIDIEDAGRVSGSRFHYLLGDLVRLEFALMQWGMDKLTGHGFTPVIPPVLVREAAMEGTGFFPEAREQVYDVPRRTSCSWSARPRCRWRRCTRGTILERGAAAAALRRLLPVLPPRGRRRRQGHARHLPRPPVRQAGDVRVLRCPTSRWQTHDQLLAIEEEIAQELGFHYRCRTSRGRPRRRRRQEVRHRGLAARPAALPGADLLLEHHRLPVAAARHPLPRRSPGDRGTCTC